MNYFIQHIKSMVSKYCNMEKWQLGEMSNTDWSLLLLLPVLEVFHKAAGCKVWRPTFHFRCDVLWWERTRCLFPEAHMIVFWEGRLTLLGVCLFLECFFVLFHPSPLANSEVRSSSIIFLTSSPVCLWAICSRLHSSATKHLLPGLSPC